MRVKTGNHDHLSVENLKVQLIAERPEIEPPDLPTGSISDDAIDSWISLQVQFGATDGQKKITCRVGRPISKPFECSVDVGGRLARIDDRKGHSLTLRRSAIS